MFLFNLALGLMCLFPQGSKLTSARQPQADDFSSGLTIVAKKLCQSARRADDLKEYIELIIFQDLFVAPRFFWYHLKEEIKIFHVAPEILQ